MQNVSDHRLLLGRFKMNGRNKPLCWECGTAEGQVPQEVGASMLKL